MNFDLTMICHNWIVCKLCGFRGVNPSRKFYAFLGVCLENRAASMEMMLTLAFCIILPFLCRSSCDSIDTWLDLKAERKRIHCVWRTCVADIACSANCAQRFFCFLKTIFAFILCVILQNPSQQFAWLVFGRNLSIQAFIFAKSPTSPCRIDLFFSINHCWFARDVPADMLVVC